MFQLLIAGKAWAPSKDSMEQARTFEHTESSLVERFKPKGVLDVDAVRAIPALFMSEGKGSEIAKIGTITRIKERGRQYEFDYVVDQDLPSFTNKELNALAGELEIDDWEFSRTHWAIKDVDLFQILLRKGAGKSAGPTVFKLSEKAVVEDDVAVMMPFSSSFTNVYKALQKAAKDVRMNCVRVDDIWREDVIIQDVVNLICESNVVICDLTEKNPNVFYEMGIAHTLGKKIIMIAQHASDVPFDVKHLRYLQYLPNAEGLEKMTTAVSQRLATLLES
jgi:nucleoside 2-deoxyribosyltransferase